jgi:nitrate reductase beta subunit
MLIMGKALQNAHLVSDEAMKRAEAQVAQRQRDARLIGRVSTILARAQKTGRPEDWRDYADQKARLPLALRHKV